MRSLHVGGLVYRLGSGLGVVGFGPFPTPGCALSIRSVMGIVFPPSFGLGAGFGAGSGFLGLFMNLSPSIENFHGKDLLEVCHQHTISEDLFGFLT